MVKRLVPVNHVTFVHGPAIAERIYTPVSFCDFLTPTRILITMKTPVLKTLGALALVSFTLSAKAIPISGGLSLTASDYTSNTGNIDTATAFTSFTGVVATSTSGTFAAGISGITLNTPGLITMNAFVFGNSPGGAGQQTPVVIWSSAPAGFAAASFTVGTFSTVTHSPGILTIAGTGVFTEAGYTSIAGTFTLTATQTVILTDQGGFLANQPTNTTFTLTMSQAAAAPDGGTTALLLFLGLVGLGFSSRRFKSVRR